MGERMKIKAVVTYCWNTLVTLLNNVKDVSFSSKKWSQKSCMLLMVLPNSIKIIFVVSFFHHLFKHPTKCKIFLKWWATWTFLPQQFLKYNAHSLSLFRSNCISKSRVCKHDPMQEEKFFNFWGEKGKEGGITLLLFTNWTQKKTLNKQTIKMASESDYTRFSASDHLICCYQDSLKIL